LSRTYAQFFLAGESGAARAEAEGGVTSIEVDQIYSEERLARAQEFYLTWRIRSDNVLARQAVEEHFAWLNENFRRLDKERAESEPIHLQEMIRLSARAYRRPLTNMEKDDLLAFYESLRRESGLTHEEAMRDLLVRVLMSPHFMYLVN
jgi:hypothetical protein